MAGKDKYGYREYFPRYYKADTELQQKVGTGALNADDVAKAQSFLDSANIDVSDSLREKIKNIESIILDVKNIDYDREEFLPKITRPLMDIKADSGMFNQMMICRVSAFLLTFLEDVRKLDNSVLDIMDVYTKVVKTLLDMKITDETNDHGQSFLSELRNACKRYYDKNAENIKG